MPLRTIARMTAFRPGQSPPPVSTPESHGRHVSRQRTRAPGIVRIGLRAAPAYVCDPRRPALRRPLLRVLPGCLGDDGEDAESQPIHGACSSCTRACPSEGPSADERRAVGGGAAPGARRRRRPRRAATASGSSGCPPREPRVGPLGSGPGAGENAERAARRPERRRLHRRAGLGASAVSVPVTNDAGLLQVSPVDGAHQPHRTSRRSRAGRARSATTRPAERTFLRLVPDDLREARLIVDRLQALGAKRPALVVGRACTPRSWRAELIEEAREAGLAPDGRPRT